MKPVNMYCRSAEPNGLTIGSGYRLFFAKYRLRIFWAILAVCIISCSPPKTRSEKFTTLEKILKDGELIVITRNSAHCYYQYRGEAMGFEYELSKAFADYLGVRLSLKIAEKWDGMIPSLENGSGALIAASMTNTRKRREKVAFSDGYMEIQQTIVVHRENAGIKTIADLSEKTIHVRRGTSYQEQLEGLIEKGMKFNLVLLDDIPTEDLIRSVAEKKRDITIADNNIALLNRRYFPQVVMSGTISEKQSLAWAVHPKSVKLLDAMNVFISSIKKNGRLAEIYNRYYGDVHLFDFVDVRAYHRRLKSRLPRYKEMIVANAEKHGFDWRLIAAQMYQESHFMPLAESHAGAYGLMQLTRSVADSLGIVDIYDPEENITAGVHYLGDLYRYFDDTMEQDRLFFTLAAYNIGQGHVRDARILAKKQGLDPDRYASIVETLPLLRYRKYYKHSGYGYCRGDEPVKYVRQIMQYYDILKRQAIEYNVRPMNDLRGL